MIEQLIAKVFSTRNCTHLAHWRTKSYAEHVALGDFYDSVVDLIDNLVECYQGNFGIIGDVKLKDANGDFLKCLEEDVVWIAENRDGIAGEIDALENIVDEITSLYLKTIYKLKNLK